MAAPRFSWLEDAGGLPSRVKAAIARLNRFEQLEIGTLEAAAPPAPAKEAPAPRPRPAPPPNWPACLHCGQPNEPERQTCWACYRLIRVRAAAGLGRPAELTLLLDGVTYDSKDPGVPEDVRALMDRIREGGYDPALLARWRAGRTEPDAKGAAPAAPASPPNRAKLEAATGVEVIRDRRVTLIRIDGRIYRSDDAAAPLEFKRLFAYIERNGVTPAFMEYLRLFGKKVKFRPSDTAEPTDGDIEFWNSAKERQLRAAAAEELALAQDRYDRATVGLYRSLVAGAVVVAYLILRWLAF